MPTLLCSILWRVVSSMALVVLVQFDGALRPPKDPCFPTLPGRMATCSFSISTVETTTNGLDNNTPTTTPLAVGSRWLPVSMDMTSAHVEYAGLLLALEQLCPTNTHLWNQVFRQKDEHKAENHPLKLMIQGDCKAVIDQLSGRSLPRRMEPWHDRAKLMLCQVNNMFQDMEYQHIPRLENSLCDNICGNLMEHIASKSWQDCQNDLDDLCDTDKHRSPPKSLSNILAEYVDSPRSRIRYSIRLPLYHRIAQVAQQQGQWDVLMRVGELLAQESQYHDDPTLILAQAITFQINGLESTANTKKARQLRQKHRILLRQHQQANGLDLVLDDSFSKNDIDYCIKSFHNLTWNDRIPSHWTPFLSSWWNHINKETDWKGYLTHNSSSSVSEKKDTTMNLG